MNILKNFKNWEIAVRPKTLGTAIAPVLIGTAMAFSEDKGHIGAALASLLCALLIQIGTNFSNDYYDFIKGADTDERLGPIRAVQSGSVTPEMMLRNFIFVFVMAFFIGIYLVYRGGWPIVIIGILSITSGILYTAGPFPLAYIGLGDLFVLFFFGPVAVGGTFYVQTLEISEVVIIAGLGPGFLATALLAVNNLRDESTDKKVGKKTLAVRLGSRFVRIEYVVAIVISLIIPFILVFWTNSHWLICLSVLILIPGREPIRDIATGLTGMELNQTLASTGKLTIIYSLLFSFGWWVS